MKKIILIPTRINSKRLPAKALLEIETSLLLYIPIKELMSKLADKVFVY